MKIFNRTSLKQQMFSVFGSVEVPEERNFLGPQETNFEQSSTSGLNSFLKSNPSTERFTNYTVSPITPNKSEVKFANVTPKKQSVTNKDKALHDDQGPVNQRPRRKKYKPKVVREEGINSNKTPNLKSGNSKSGNSDPGFLPRKPASPILNAPITPELKINKPKISVTPNWNIPIEMPNSISGNSNPNFAHKNPEPSNSEVFTPNWNIPIETSNSKSGNSNPSSPHQNPEPSNSNSFTPNWNIPIETSNSKSGNSNPSSPHQIPEPSNSNLIIQSDLKQDKGSIELPITPNPKSENPKDEVILDLTPDPKPVKKDIVYVRRDKRGVNHKNKVKNIILYTRRKKGVINIKNEKDSNLVKKDILYVRRDKRGVNHKNKVKDIVYTRRKKGAINIKNDKVSNLDKNRDATVLSFDDVVVPVRQPVRRRLDFGNEAKTGTKADENVENCGNVIKDSNIGTIPNQSVNKSSIGTGLNYENLIKEGIISKKSNKNPCYKNMNNGFGRLDLDDNLDDLFLYFQRKNKRKKATKPKRELTLEEMLDDIILKLESLKLNLDTSAIVPFVKEKIRAKVVLTQETIKEWKIIMGKGDDASSASGEDLKDEEYWRVEREIITKRALWFIEQMKRIQGDRKFSKWKGSVVDSVVGAFLTQNVSDHMSSSAFISLAARFPPKKDGNTCTWPDKKFADSLWEKAKSGSCSDAEETDTSSEEETKVGKSGYAPGTENRDWDELRRIGLKNRREKNNNNSNNNNNNNNNKIEDSIDWEAVRNADVDEVAKAIHGRGMDNVLAGRIQDFLNRVINDHGSIDLEWLRDIPDEQAKEFLLSIYGIGLKSAECIRLLSLHQVAFPVDTNVGRICVRLGWVPIEPLPDSVQMHLLELYPVMDSIQMYLWPRLCKLDQRTLYELHYQMITFGKVFCTKSQPNCNACPLRNECKHFASAYASTRLALPGPKSKEITKPRNQIPVFTKSSKNSEPIIEEPEEPSTPIEENQESPMDIDDLVLSDSEEIPVLKLKSSFVRSDDELVRENGRKVVRENNEIPLCDIEDLCTPKMPVLKLKTNSIMRNDEELVRENDRKVVRENHEIPLCDIEDLCKGLVRESDREVVRENHEIPQCDIEDLCGPKIPAIKLDMHSFARNVEDIVRERDKEAPIEDISRALVLLPSGDASIPVPKLKNVGRLRTVHDVYVIPDSHPLLRWLQCEERDEDDPCPYLLALRYSDKINDSEMLSEDEKDEFVQCSIMIPSRTAMRGSFPLNGTYFQTNEVFADHSTARNPIWVSRHEIWNLRRLPCYFGSSVSAILKGLPTDKIQLCFWRGFLCVREFDRETRCPRPLSRWLHSNTSQKKTGE